MGNPLETHAISWEKHGIHGISMGYP